MERAERLKCKDKVLISPEKHCHISELSQNDYSLCCDVRIVRAHVGTRHPLQPATDLAGRPRLLPAAPIVAVSEKLNRHVGELTRLAPASDATTALTLYRDRVANALAQARNIELFVPVDVAANMLGKSPSGITYLCRAGALAHFGEADHAVRSKLITRFGGS